MYMQNPNQTTNTQTSQTHFQSSTKHSKYVFTSQNDFSLLIFPFYCLSHFVVAFFPFFSFQFIMKKEKSWKFIVEEALLPMIFQLSI